MRLPAGKRQRGTYIGGHDASAILGLNPYRSAGDVYAGIVHGWQQERTPRMLRGLIVEEGLMSHAAQMRGTELRGAELIAKAALLAQVLDEAAPIQIARDAFFLDDRIPFFGGSVDAVESPFDRPRIIHEAKSTLANGFGTEPLATRWGPDGTDDVERTAWLQVQWYMGITGAQEAHVWLLVLDGDEEPRHYIVPRNRTAIVELREAAEAFWWDHVVPRVPPAVAPKNDGAANAMHPNGVKDLKIPASDALKAAAAVFAEARTQAKVLEEVKDTAGATIKNILGQAEKASWDGGSISWKESKLQPATNWEQVAHELALKFRIPGEQFIGIVREETKPRRTARVLRVTISDPTKKTNTTKK